MPNCVGIENPRLLCLYCVVLCDSIDAILFSQGYQFPAWASTHLPSYPMLVKQSERLIMIKLWLSVRSCLTIIARTSDEP